MIVWFQVLNLTAAHSELPIDVAETHDRATGTLMNVTNNIKQVGVLLNAVSLSLTALSHVQAGLAFLYVARIEDSGNKHEDLAYLRQTRLLLHCTCVLHLLSSTPWKPAFK